MSATAQILDQVRAEVNKVLADYAEGSRDLTQLKRENTGLRNRVKALEDRVTALENAGKPVTVQAQTAEVKGTASGK